MPPPPLDLHDPKTRLSLQPPAGLPSPIKSSFSSSQETPAASSSSCDYYPSTLPDVDDQDEPDDNTLISCFTHLGISSLPLPPPYGDPRGGATGPVVTRFPRAPAPRPSSIIGSRQEQRRIYLGPKLSDRATGGPDAGPLIERFSCLFKDRRFSF